MSGKRLSIGLILKSANYLDCHFVQNAEGILGNVNARNQTWIRILNTKK